MMTAHGVCVSVSGSIIVSHCMESQEMVCLLFSPAPQHLGARQRVSTAALRHTQPAVRLVQTEQCDSFRHASHPLQSAGETPSCNALPLAGPTWSRPSSSTACWMFTCL